MTVDLRKKRLAAVLCVAAVAAVFVFWRGRHAPVAEVPTVKSADGVVSLAVPADALPEGVSLQDLSIALRPADPARPVSGDEASVAYELLPDGLRFRKPVEISLTFDEAEDGLVPFVLHASGHGDAYVAEPLAVRAAFDRENKKVTVTGEIAHFSEIDAWPRTGLWTVTSQTGGIFHHMLGESFDVSLKVKPTGKKIRHVYRERYAMNWSEITVSVSPEASWSFSGGFTTRHGKLDPQHADFDLPALAIGQAAEIDQPFKCAKGGWDKVESRDVGGAIVKYRLVKEYGGGQKPDNDAGTMKVDILEDHECKTVPPPPPPPATANQPAVVNVSVGTLDAVEGSASLGGKKYYKVTSTDKTRDTGNEVCAAAGKTCVGYTDLTIGSCLAFHPGAMQSTDFNGSKAGFYCDGAPQGGVCAKEANTCHICPQCNINMDCAMEIGVLYRETYVECE